MATDFQSTFCPSPDVVASAAGDGERLEVSLPQAFSGWPHKDQPLGIDWILAGSLALSKQVN